MSYNVSCLVEAVLRKFVCDISLSGDGSTELSKV